LLDYGWYSGLGLRCGRSRCVLGAFFLDVFWRERAFWLLVNACLRKMRSGLLPERRVGRDGDGECSLSALKDRRTDTANQRGGSEWEPIKNLLEGDGGSNKMNTTSNTRLPTYYPSWPTPHSHWSATGPRNQLSTSHTRECSGTQNSSLTDLHRSGR
jgi:hypothetical protein